MAPEKIVVTELAEERTVPIEPTTLGTEDQDEHAGDKASTDVDGSTDNTAKGDIRDRETIDRSKDDSPSDVVTPDKTESDNTDDQSGGSETDVGSDDDSESNVVTPDKTDGDSSEDQSGDKETDVRYQAECRT